MKRRRNTKRKSIQLRKNGEYGIAFAVLIPLISAVVGGGASIFASSRTKKAAEAQAAAQQQQAMVDAQIAQQRTTTALTVAGIVAGTAIVGVVLWKMLGSNEPKHEKKTEKKAA